MGNGIDVSTRYYVIMLCQDDVCTSRFEVSSFTPNTHKLRPELFPTETWNCLLHFSSAATTLSTTTREAAIMPSQKVTS